MIRRLNFIYPIAIFLLFFVACKDYEPIDILIDYDVALTNEKSLRYFYHRIPENDTTWTDYQTLCENGEKFVVETFFEKSKPTSLIKYKVTGRTLELVEKIYYHVKDSVTGDTEAVSADIMQHLENEPEAEYSGFSFVDYHEMPMGIGMKLKSTSSYVGKEFYHYDNRDIESIRLKHQFRTLAYFKWFPFYFHEAEYNGYVIFSKGVGMTMYHAEDLDGKVYRQTLIRVEELM